MVKSAWRKYPETIRRRYRKACRKDKKPILDKSCAQLQVSPQNRPSSSQGCSPGRRVKAGCQTTFDSVRIAGADQTYLICH